MSVAAPERVPGVVQIADDDWAVTPAFLGPVWDTNPLWDGPRDPDNFILPHLTLGWQAIRWAEENCLADESSPEEPIPFRFTNEQMRFILWFYAIDETGRFIYREYVLQRLKGWGKDPLAAIISAIEFVGPCRFAGWATVSEDPEQAELDLAWLAARDLEPGDPVARPHPKAWIQIAAVSKEQTKNTMTIFAGLFTEECKREHSIDLGKEVIYAYHGQRRIEAVTSSPRSLEGNRPTLVIKNETHHWLPNNDGVAMAEAIERNATKAKGGAARTLSITNAYEPSEESVARAEREAYEAGIAGTVIKTDTCYDSLEAPRDARLQPKMDGVEDVEEQERLTRRYLTRVLEACRGDAWWLDIPSLVNSILNPKNKASTSRRFWYNQVVASEDAWADPRAVDASINQMARENRLIMARDSHSVLEAGWIVHPDDPIVMFGDGSKSDDATGLVGVRLSDGYVFTIGIWSPPAQKERAKTWLAPREAVDARVNEAFRRFNIVAFWFDPSHAKDDEDGSRYWDGLIDKWMRVHKAKLDPAYWATKSGHRAHAVMFDMTSPERRKLFIGAAEEFIEDLETLNDIEEFEPSFSIDGHPALVQHLKNAHKHPTPDGVTLMKENRESKNKIDLAVCAVGARMLAKIVLNKGLDEAEKPGTVWGYGF